MEGERGDFNDWEVLHNSDAGVLVDSADKSFDDIDGGSEGMIRSDYFSLDNRGRLAAEVTEEDSAESDNPSWIDPAVSETRMMSPAEFWSDSASDRSEDRKFGDFDTTKEVSFLENSTKKSQPEEEPGEIHALNDNDSREFWSDAGGDKSAAEEDGAKLTGAESGGGCGNEDVAAVEEPVRSLAKTTVPAEGERKSVAWWKVPMEVLKFCAFRVSPVWTLSVAAAVLGMIMLGKRLYRMKRKTQNLQLKVTMDDKKVSHFMTQAARLNEAFSVVKRVPIVRPSLPAPGSIAPWPVMSLR